MNFVTTDFRLPTADCGLPTALPSPAILHISLQLLVELLFFQEILQADMHPVLPVIFGVCRVIDPLFVGILTAKCITHAQDIL